MKTKKSLAIISLAAALIAAGSAMAAGVQQKELDQLSEAKNRLVVGSQAVKPNQASRMRDEAADLQKLIDSARAGKKLDASSVDQAIRRSYQGF